MITETDLEAPYFKDRFQFIGPPLHIFQEWTNIADIEREKFTSRCGQQPTKHELDYEIKKMHTHLQTVNWEMEMMDQLKYRVLTIK